MIDAGSAGDLKAGDNFLLCSDGLYAYFSETEMAGTIAAHPARRASEMLIELARKRANGKGDNCTVIILKLEAPADRGQGQAIPTGKVTHSGTG